MGNTITLVLTFVVAIGSLGILILAMVLISLRPRISELLEHIQATATGAQRTLLQVEELVRELRDKGLVDKIEAALSDAQGAVGKIDPLATDLSNTLTDARGLLDDATQTSQSVRARIDDLAATQAELNALTSSLTDVMSEVRDRDVAAKLANVLSDTSLLTADIGILTENANSYLEHGKPLVGNIRNVVDNARSRASGISATLGGIRDGVKASQKAAKDE